MDKIFIINVRKLPSFHPYFRFYGDLNIIRWSQIEGSVTKSKASKDPSKASKDLWMVFEGSTTKMDPSHIILDPSHIFRDLTPYLSLYRSVRL